jgi:hypothetical protein
MRGKNGRRRNKDITIGIVNFRFGLQGTEVIIINISIQIASDALRHNISH